MILPVQSNATTARNAAQAVALALTHQRSNAPISTVPSPKNRSWPLRNASSCSNMRRHSEGAASGSSPSNTSTNANAVHHASPFIGCSLVEPAKRRMVAWVWSRLQSAVTAQLAPDRRRRPAAATQAAAASAGLALAAAAPAAAGEGLRPATRCVRQAASIAMASGQRVVPKTAWKPRAPARLCHRRRCPSCRHPASRERNPTTDRAPSRRCAC